MSIATSRQPINRRILVETDAHFLNLCSHTPTAHSRRDTARFADTFRTYGYVSSSLRRITARLIFRSQSIPRHQLATAASAFVCFYSIGATCNIPRASPSSFAVLVAHTPLACNHGFVHRSPSPRTAHLFIPCQSFTRYLLLSMRMRSELRPSPETLPTTF